MSTERARMRRLARLIHRSRRENRMQARGAQAAYRSVEGSDGAVSYYDEDGSLRMQIGVEDEDGIVTVVESNPEPPPTPTPPTVFSQPGVIVISHDGSFEDANTPADFAYFEVHASNTPDYFADDSTQIGTLPSTQGGTFTYPSLAEEGTKYISVQAVNRSGVESDKSLEVSAAGDPFPEAPPPTEPPEESPTIEVTGTVDALVVRAGSVAPSTSIQYHISTTEAFTPDSSTLWDTTRSNVVVITTLPDESPLELGLTYFLRAVAENAAGEAPPSAEVSGILDTTRVSQVVVAEIVAGFILTGRIDIGVGYWDADEGLKIPQPDGGVIWLPVDGVTPAQITAHLIAKTLEVQGTSALYGETLLSGLIELANGVTNPRIPATVGTTHDNIVIIDDEGEQWYGPWAGLNEKGDGTTWVTALLSNDVVQGIVDIDKTTGATAFHTISGPNLSGFLCEGFIVLPVSGAMYMMGRDSNRSNQRYIYVINTSYVKTGEFAISGGFATTPVLGWDDRSGSAAICVAWIDVNGDTRVRRYGMLGNLMETLIFPGSPGSASGVRGCVLHEADIFTGRAWIAYDGTERKVRAYNTSTLARQSDIDFSYGGAAVPTRSGLLWADGQFWTLDTAGRIWEYEPHPSASTVDIGYTWYDGVGTTHESALGASAKTGFVWPPRTKMAVETPAAPQVEEAGSDIANQIRIYGKPSAGPTYFLQATLPIGVRNAEISGDSWISSGGTPPPSTNGFSGIGVEPGRIFSAAKDVVHTNLAMTELLGSGKARIIGEDTWHVIGNPGEPSFQNGFSEFSTDSCMFRRSPTGYVTLLIDVSIPSGSSATNPGPMFTLPAATSSDPGYRPAKTMSSNYCFRNAAAGDRFCTVAISTNGEVTWADLGVTGGNRIAGTITYPIY